MVIVSNYDDILIKYKEKYKNAEFNLVRPINDFTNKKFQKGDTLFVYNKVSQKFESTEILSITRVNDYNIVSILLGSPNPIEISSYKNAEAMHYDDEKVTLYVIAAGIDKYNLTEDIQGEYHDGVWTGTYIEDERLKPKDSWGRNIDRDRSKD